MLYYLCILLVVVISVCLFVFVCLCVCFCVHEDVGMKRTLSRTFVEKILTSEYKLKMFSSYILQAGPTSFVFFFFCFYFF